MTTQKPAEQDATITRTVLALAAGQSLPYTQLVKECGMSIATGSRRRNQGGWTAVEVATFARRLGCSVSDLYTGFDGIIGVHPKATGEFHGVSSLLDWLPLHEGNPSPTVVAQAA